MKEYAANGAPATWATSKAISELPDIATGPGDDLPALFAELASEKNSLPESTEPLIRKIWNRWPATAGSGEFTKSNKTVER